MRIEQGTHVWTNNGWEISVHMAILSAPVILYLGLTNVPETDSEVFARCVRDDTINRRIAVVVVWKRCAHMMFVMAVCCISETRRLRSARATSSLRSSSA